MSLFNELYTKPNGKKNSHIYFRVVSAGLNFGEIMQYFKLKNSKIGRLSAYFLKYWRKKFYNKSSFTQLFITLGSSHQKVNGRSTPLFCLCQRDATHRNKKKPGVTVKLQKGYEILLRQPILINLIKNGTRQAKSVYFAILTNCQDFQFKC